MAHDMLAPAPIDLTGSDDLPGLPDPAADRPACRPAVRLPAPRPAVPPASDFGAAAFGRHDDGWDDGDDWDGWDDHRGRSASHWVLENGRGADLTGQARRW